MNQWSTMTKTPFKPALKNCPVPNGTSRHTNEPCLKTSSASGGRGFPVMAPPWDATSTLTTSAERLQPTATFCWGSGIHNIHSSTGQRTYTRKHDARFVFTRIPVSRNTHLRCLKRDSSLELKRKIKRTVEDFLLFQRQPTLLPLTSKVLKRW